MNIFKKLYCRTFQFVFKLALPFLPYRQPKMLKTDADVVEVLLSQKKKSVLLVTGSTIRGLGLTKSLEKAIKESGVHLAVFDQTVSNPTSGNVEKAYNIFRNHNCDSIVAFGGGSVMDCAKAVGARAVYPNKSLKKMKGVMKVRRKIPLLIAVPTTAGTGSETTLTAVITDSFTRHKYTINSFPLIPSYALLNADLTVGLPPQVTSTTGMDALTHAVEAYIGRTTTRQTRKCALEATKLVFENLPKAYKKGTDKTARQNMLEASFKAGVAFTQSYVGYVHAIAHSIGGKYNTAHGLANAVILPYVLKYYGKCIYKKLWRMGVYAGLFDKSVSYEQGAKLFVKAVEDLSKKMSIPKTLEVIQEGDILELATTAEKEANPLYPVPKLMTKEELEIIYRQVKLGK